MARPDRLGPQCAHDENLVSRQMPGQIVDHLQRGLGGPVEVVQDQDQRAVASIGWP